MDTQSDFDLLAGMESAPSTESTPPFGSILIDAGLFPEVSDGQREWLSQLDTARASLEEMLSLALGGDVTITLRASGFLEWNALLDLTQSGGAIGAGAGPGANGAHALWYEPSAAGILLESVLGGSPGNAVAIARDLSDLERQFIGNMVRNTGKIVFPEMPPVPGCDAESPAFDIVPIRFLQQLADPFSRARCAEFQILFGEITSGALVVINSGDLAVGVETNQQRKPAKPSMKRQRLEKLGAVNLDFEVKLDGNSIGFGDLVNLQVGDVIALGTELTSLLTGRLNSAVAFEGTIVPAGVKKAFRIERFVPLAP